MGDLIYFCFIFNTEQVNNEFPDRKPGYCVGALLVYYAGRSFCLQKNWNALHLWVDTVGNTYRTEGISSGWRRIRAGIIIYSRVIVFDVPDDTRNRHVQFPQEQI